MKSEELTIETLAVEIKVIRVGGHKMTVAVFDQLQQTTVADILNKHWTADISPELAILFINQIENQEIDIKGYINRKGLWALCVYRGGIWRNPARQAHLRSAPLGRRSVLLFPPPLRVVMKGASNDGF